MKYLPDINGSEDLKKLELEQLEELAAEIRQQLISTVSHTGGHLATNLGAVELTIALHYVFNLPEDKFVWDVGHQVYTHKLLSGRYDRFDTIRQYDGLSGFTKRSESEYDCFGAGHASTSISAALGFAAARDQVQQDHKVVAIIGDGSMTGGLAFEGLNNAGTARKDLLVILNDNAWSISQNVGALSKYLTSIMADEKFNRLRDEVWELTGKFKRRDKIRSTIAHIEQSLKGLLVPGMFFQKLGFRYFGPIDGHDLSLTVKTLQSLTSLKGPLLLHLATKKGKGFQPAEGDPTKFHGIGKFDKFTGKSTAKALGLPDYTSVFGDCMVELGRKDKRVVAITAAMSTGTGLVLFSKEFPDRFYDVGIAEGHAGCFASGMAAGGSRPYLTVYSTFMQRAVDQVVHDMALQKLPVVICMDRGGLVGEDGPTHHGVFDLSIFASIPDLTIAAPCDGNELRGMLHYTIDNELSGPVAIRYPRAKVPVPMESEIPAIEWGKWTELTERSDIAVLAVGAMVEKCEKVAQMMKAEGVDLYVVNARFVKPLDLDLLESIRIRCSTIITVEENAIRGGFGSAVATWLIEQSFSGKFKAIGLSDKFVTHGARELLLRDTGLDVDGIQSTIRALVNSGDGNQSGLLPKLRQRRETNSDSEPAIDISKQE